MNIVHIVTLASNDGAFGGPLRVALNQVGELRRRGHHAELVVGWIGDQRPPGVLDGVPIKAFRAYRLLPRSGFSGLYSPGVSRWLERELTSQHVVHAHVGRDLISISGLARSVRKRCPIVVQSHGMLAPDTRIRARIFDLIALRKLVRRADRILFLTDEERMQLRAVFEDVIPPLQRIRNGVVTPSDRTSETAGKEVIYCARLHSRKRPVAFVEMAQLVSSKEHIKFSLVGPDEGELGNTTGKIAELNLQDMVRYEGALPYDRVIERMRRATIYVLPSVDEPFPMSLLEAMSLGLPAVCTDTCGISNELRRAEAAIVTDGTPASMAAAVDRLLADESARRELGAKAKKLIAEQFSIEAVVDELAVLYRTISRVHQVV